MFGINFLRLGLSCYNGFDGHGYTSNTIFLFSLVLVTHKIQQLLYEHRLVVIRIDHSFKMSVLEMMCSSSC